MEKKETKSKVFQRLATQRTSAILNRIRILGNCANPRLYEYSDVEVKKIFRAIESELRVTKAKFLNSNRSHFQL